MRKKKGSSEVLLKKYDWLEGVRVHAGKLSDVDSKVLKKANDFIVIFSGIPDNVFIDVEETHFVHLTWKRGAKRRLCVSFSPKKTAFYDWEDGDERGCGTTPLPDISLRLEHELMKIADL